MGADWMLSGDLAFDVDFIPNPSDPYSLRHSEYGYDNNPDHRQISQYMPGSSLKASDEEPIIWIYFLTYFNCKLLVPVTRLFFGASADGALGFRCSHDCDWTST